MSQGISSRENEVGMQRTHPGHKKCHQCLNIKWISTFWNMQTQFSQIPRELRLLSFQYWDPNILNLLQGCAHFRINFPNDNIVLWLFNGFKLKLPVFYLSASIDVNSVLWIPALSFTVQSSLQAALSVYLTCIISSSSAKLNTHTSLDTIKISKCWKDYSLLVLYFLSRRWDHFLGLFVYLKKHSVFEGMDREIQGRYNRICV